MSSTAVRETCSCGAEFIWTGWAVHESRSLQAWRDGHRHEMPATPSPAPSRNATKENET